MNPEPLEFGCVVELRFPDQEPALGHVSYVDPRKEYAVIWMVAEKEYKAFQMNADFELVDPVLQSYRVKSYPTEPGYARQTGLVPGQWVEIRLHYDGTVYKGQVTDLVEDMITVHLTVPSEMEVYFDFEYRGLIPELGIYAFVKINPSSTPRPSSSPEEHVDDDPLYNEEGERVDSISTPVDEGDDIIEDIGEDMSVVVDVEITDNQKQFDLKRQLTEIVDKLYASYGDRAITPLMHAHIADVIDRFVVSRATYTKMDVHGTAIGVNKAFEDYRPFYHSFETRSPEMTQSSYLWPISTIQKIIYFTERNIDEYALYADDGGRSFTTHKWQQHTLAQEKDIQLSNLPYLDKRNQLDMFRVPFDRVDPVLPNTSTHPIETLVRNGDPPVPTQTLNITDFHSRVRSQPGYTQTYLPGEYMNIHSVYKPPTPHIRHIRRSRYVNPLTPVFMKTVQMQSNHYSSMWRPPIDLPIDHVHPVADKNAFPVLPAIVHEMAHRFRHCTSYGDTLRVLEEYATRPQQVDKNTASQLIHIVDTNIVAHKKQYQKHFEYVKQLSQRWPHTRPEYPQVQDILPEYSAMHVQNIPDEDILEYRGKWMDPVEIQHMAMESDAATLLALMERYKNAKLYMEERVIPSMDEMSDLPVLAKEYETKEDLMADASGILFFDKRYDTTPYPLLRKYKNEQASMAPDAFREWFQETLFQAHGVPVDKTAEVADWILAGARPVQEGYYAKVNSPPSFYRRTAIPSWELDDTVRQEMFLPAKELLQNVEYQASALSKIQDYDAYTTAAHHLNQVDAEVDRRVASVFHTSVRNIQTMIRDQKQKALTRNTYTYHRDIRPYVAQYKLGQKRNDTGTILTSPFFQILNAIREKGGSSKDVLILQFYKKYCTDSSVLYLPTEPTTPYWKYCIETGTPLLPTSEYELAKLSLLRQDDQIQMERARIFSKVAIELDGNMYDKYTGYLLQEGIFEFQEQFTEDGHLNRGHEIVSTTDRQENEMVEQQLAEARAESIFPTEVANVVNVIDSVKYTREVTKYVLFEPVQYALSIASNLKIGATQIQLPLVRMANSFKSEIKSEDSYNRKLKDGSPTYAVYKHTMHMILAVNILLVAIHTAIPPFSTRPLIPSYQTEQTDIGQLWKRGMDELFTYVQHLAANQTEPWVILADPSTGRIPAARFKKNSLKFFTDKMQPSPIIQAMYRAKLEYAQTVTERKQRERTTYDWPGFLPYLRPIRELEKPRVRATDSQNSILNASYVQAMYIMKQINEAIETEPMVMQTLANVPYLENGCCNKLDYSIFPLDYFIEKHKLDIDMHIREEVDKVRRLQLHQKQMPFFFSKPCPTNARDIVMETEQFRRDKWTESIKNTFLIYYLNLNETRGYVGVPAPYSHVLANIPPNWNKNASEDVQKNTFAEVPLRLDISIEDFIKDIWIQETHTRPLWVSEPVPLSHRLTEWVQAQSPQLEETGAEVVSGQLRQFYENQRQRVSSTKDLLSAWVQTKYSDAYIRYEFKGMDPDEIIEHIQDPIETMTTLLSKNTHAMGRKCLTQLDAKIAKLYHSPDSFHELVGFIRNMIYVDTTMGLVRPEWTKPSGFSDVSPAEVDSFIAKSFLYPNKEYITPSMRMHLQNIQTLQLFAPWIQLVDSLMEMTPLKTDEGSEGGEEDDPYVYRGLPPYILARLYQYAWLNVWFIWYTVARSIPANVRLPMDGVEDMEEDVYSTERVTTLVKTMMNTHFSYHGTCMMDVLMSEDDISKQTHLTKQSEKRQIMDQYKDMTQKDRNLQRALIICGLSRYQLNEPVRGDEEGPFVDEEGGVVAEGEDVEAEGEGEGVDLLGDGNMDNEENE